MATGATGQLGLALPVQGELSGTWGDTVNNGITQYTNIAIAGTLTLTGDGAVTLANTTGDNSASNITSTLTGAGTVTAQFAIVRVTGTLTTAKIITGPSYSKTYLVVNAATGSTVSFIRAGQTPAISIAVGESALVYFNGTDYVKLVGTATAGAAGGSTTQVQFNSSGVLAGSANMTFDGTSMTLGGNPTLSAGTANGVTYLNGSKVLTSGSALTFDGTTLYTSGAFQSQGGTADTVSITGGNAVASNSTSGLTLNASSGSGFIALRVAGDERARITSTGLGIGTTSFTAKLTAKTAANTYTGGALALVSSSSTSTYLTNIGGALYVSNDGSTDHLVLSSAGNLGLGVTPDAWASGNKVLNIGGAYANYLIGSTSVSSIQLGTNGYYGSGGWTYKTTDYASFYQQYQGKHIWNNAPSGTAGNSIAFTQAMTLDASGNLGLGATSITAVGSYRVLEVNGTTGGYIALSTAGTRGASFFGTTSGVGIEALGASNFLQFYTNSSERLRIASTGAFGLSGANYGTSGQVLTSGGSGAAPTWTTVGGGSSQWTTTGSDIYYNTGFVGIGNTAPTTVLHTTGANGTSATTLATSYTYAKLRFQNSSASSLSAYQGVVNSGDTWYTQIANGAGTASYNMVFNPFGGNFGVGTTNPAAKVEFSTDAGAVTEVLRLSSTSGTGYLTYIGFKNPGLSNAVTRIYGGNTGNDGSGKFQVSVTNASGTEQTIMYAINTVADQYTSFSTNGSERMRITGTGNLLVGTTSQLVTNITATITKSQAPNLNSAAWADQMGPLVVYGDFGNGSNAQTSTSALTVVGWSSAAGGVGSIMRGWWSNNGPNLGTPVLQFQIASNGNVTNTNNSYGSLSDARLKENITDATSKLNGIKQLRVVNFNLKDDPKKLKQIGLIAQEVETVFPALVETSADDEETKSVKYSVLVPMLVKAMQEQQAIIESLKARLDAANL